MSRLPGRSRLEQRPDVAIPDFGTYSIADARMARNGMNGIGAAYPGSPRAMDRR
jgi:hypothetical protein